jgi:hypothetical protein
MKKVLISRRRVRGADAGVTMILVAICMVAIVAMAALSIDVVTLYLARMEAQRTADTAALAAARVISLSGITGDPSDSSGYWSQICGGSTGVATLAAQAVATQTVDNVAPTVTVTYSGGGTSNASCVGLPAAFGVNPTVTVQVTRSNLPTFFSHMWGNTGNTTSATATAEAFNPSNSSNVGNSGATGVITPVWPRCVKPWMVPNLDPLNPAHCTTGCTGFVDKGSGQINNPGISLNGGNTNGVIGETFWLSPDCHNTGSSCRTRTGPQANYTASPHLPYTLDLLYVPGQAPTSTPAAVPSAASGGDLYEQAIAGCDQSTQYQCGTPSGNTVDLTNENPVSSSDTTNGVTALIGENNPNSSSQPDGQDQLNPYAAPSSYPFQILAGGSNPYLSSGSAVSGSSSIVTVPIYDYTGPSQIGPATTAVTIVGFLQVFINAVDQYGNVSVTVLNVSGCGNGTTTTGTAVAGSSPVPIRLISQ